MKKITSILTTAICGCGVATLAAIDSAAVSAAPLESSGNSSRTAMGFLISDGNLPVSWCSFPLDDARQLTQISAAPKVSAGAMADGTYYAQTYTTGPSPLAWYTVDVNNGSMTKLADATESTPLYVDMTYDYASHKLWGIYHHGGTSSMLCEINPADGSAITATDISGKWLQTLACSYDGELFAIAADGYLYRFDNNNNEFNKVGFVENDIEYMQSMDFDHQTETIYWASSTSYNGCLYTVNPDTGTATYISPLGTSGEMTGLYVPFSLAADGAPGAVSGYSLANPLHDGEISIQLTLPEVKADGSTLETIEGLTLECDNEIIKHWTSTEVALTPGSSLTLTATATEGYHTFKIYALNSAGKGLPSSVKAFIGEDVPAAPRSIVVEVDGNQAKISWQEVTSGHQGGYIDATSLAYNVTRLPDNKVVITGTRQLSCNDEVDAMGVYTYQVTATTGKGAGPVASSESVVIGNGMTIPYNCGFTSEDDLLLWSMDDANDDGLTWQRIVPFSGTPYMKMGYNMKPADDWLISPPLYLEAGKSYKIIYQDFCMNPYYPAAYDVTFGNGPSPAEQNLVLKTSLADKSSRTTRYVYLPEITTSGNYNIGFHAKWETSYAALNLAEINIEENTAARFTATVTDGNSPLPGAKVEFGTDKTVYITDDEGKIEVIEIVAGTYPVDVSIFGFEPRHLDLTFAQLEDKHLEIKMEEIDKGNVEGRVLDFNGQPLPDVTVYLHGYDEYQTVTDRDGRYNIVGAYRCGEYAIDYHATNYESVTVNIGELSQENQLDDVMLNVKLIAPDNLTHDYSRELVTLRWDAPVDRPASFRYDDGTDNYVHNMEMSAVTEYTVVGVIYDTPAVFTSMSWNVWDTATYAETADIIVFDLDDNEQPTNRILYEENGLESDNYNWHECRFRHPIVAPRGALFTLRGDARLCMDSGVDTEYPHRPDKMVYTLDYRTIPFTSRYPEGDNIFRGNLTLRAEGLPYGAPRMASASGNPLEVAYDVYRMAATDNGNENAWTKLNAAPVTDTGYADSGWNTLPKGEYRYAVKAVYPDGYSSLATFSEMVPRQLKSDCRFSLSTNVEGETAEGATLSLVGANDNSRSYTALVDQDENAVISGVWEGNYILTCSKKGFSTISKEITVQGETDFETALTLAEQTDMPSGLIAEETGEPSQRLLRWNIVDGMFDDFESHDDWTINSPGEIGWSYIDGDGYETYSSPSYEFPNMRQKMAFIVMNPSQTDYSMLDAGFLDTHSGDRAIVSFCTSNGEPNDDYIVSPALEMANDFVISFWARCYDERRYPETIRVGYSIGSADKDDFLWVGDPISVDTETWRQYIVNIPREAKYVAINYISTDKYYVAIDDIFIGAADKIPAEDDTLLAAAYRSPSLSPVGQPVAYEVYLDGDKLATTTETSYLLENLADGEHIAGVKSRYASGITDMAVVNFTISRSGIVVNPTLTDMVSTIGNRIIIDTAPGTDVTIYAADGKTVYSATAVSGHVELSLEKGVYVIVTPTATCKVAIR